MDAARVFVSYAHEDRRRVLQLVQRLRGEGWSVWIDVEELRGAGQWAVDIHEAIRTCDVFLLLITPASMHSHRVPDELELAKRNHRRIVPVMFESAQIPPQIEYNIASLQLVDHTADTDWQYADLDAALRRALTRKRPQTRHRAALLFGGILSAIAMSMCVGALGWFFALLAQAWNAPLGSGPPPDIPRAFLLFFAGFVVAIPGGALYRYGRRLGR